MSTPTKYEGHTPGDWQVALHVGLPVVLDAHGTKLFDVICTDGLERVRMDETYRLELMANACLIADAPALLAENERLREALEDLLNNYACSCHDYKQSLERCARCKLAIQEARGALAEGKGEAK